MLKALPQTTVPVGAAAASDTADFAAFYHAHERLVRSVVWPLVGASDCDDVVQCTFLRAWEKRHTVRDPGAMRRWVATIAVNQARDTWRKRRPSVPVDEVELVATQAPVDNSAAVMAAVQCLDFEHREVIVLRFFQDKSLAEVAEILGVPEGTVKSRTHHAKLKLKACLTKMGVAYE